MRTVTFEFYHNDSGKIFSRVFIDGEPIGIAARALKYFQEASHESKIEAFHEAEADAFYQWTLKNGIEIRADMLPDEVRHPLESRGNSLLDIQNMSAEEMAIELFNWHGHPEWGSTYLRWCRVIDKACQGDPPREGI